MSVKLLTGSVGSGYRLKVVIDASVHRFLLGLTLEIKINYINYGYRWQTGSAECFQPIRNYQHCSPKVSQSWEIIAQKSGDEPLVVPGEGSGCSLVDDRIPNCYFVSP